MKIEKNHVERPAAELVARFLDAMRQGGLNQTIEFGGPKASQRPLIFNNKKAKSIQTHAARSRW